MKVVTPEISWHGKEPVYSVDFQPGNRPIQRLASASVDKLVRIWQVKVDSEGKPTVEFLSNLRRHTRSVNVCRFSPDGDILASAGDDNVILFWRLSDTPTPANNIFGEEDEDNKESWISSTTLRGHLEDVYDLCWSADGRHLISGSVDNSAILWDTVKELKLALFNEHKSFVQGVALDPLNEFAATLSTDRSCRVFNIANKNCIHNVSKMTLPSSNPDPEVKQKPFRMYHDDTMGSFFRRLTFSPDGQFLITPAGCVEQGDKVTNATFIFTRNCLSKPALFLPSPQKPTIAVRACPQLFKLRKNNKNTNDKENNNENEWEKYSTLFCLPYRVVFAVVTEDAVLLYDTQQTKPFAYISNTHYLQMTDITWASDGRTVVVSSTDGFCTLITFDAGEIGEPYTRTEKEPATNAEKEPATNTEKEPATRAEKDATKTTDNVSNVNSTNTKLSPPSPKKTTEGTKATEGTVPVASLNNPAIDVITLSSPPPKKEAKEDAPIVSPKAPVVSLKVPIISPKAPVINPKESGQQSENQPMEADTDDLILILDESTNDATSFDKSHKTKSNKTDSKVKCLQSLQNPSSLSVKPIKALVKSQSNEDEQSKLSVKPSGSNSSSTPGNKPKRIQFQTISLLKPK